MSRLRLLSAGALRQIEEHAQDSVAAWAGRWIPGAAPTCRALIAADAGPAEPATWRPVGEDAWWCAGDGACRALALALAGTRGDGPHGAIATGVITACMGDLVAGLSAAETGSDGGPPDERLFGDRAGAVVIEVDAVDGAPVNVLLGPSRVDALVPRAEPTPLELVPRDSALDGAPVYLEASLDLGRFTVGDLDSLAPGDVIASGLPVDTPFELRTTGGAGLARCRPVRRGDRLALVLTQSMEMREER